MNANQIAAIVATLGFGVAFYGMSTGNQTLSLYPTLVGYAGAGYLLYSLIKSKVSTGQSY